ncbi:hypothetical protein SORBI_3001G068066 [Sorghum bicolor]|uniref:Uncharacterized protein n=1 Tax=Sorghum bicolor TaxID=4558 RepID=A0A1Z5S4P4_SORBI|nr:hypothetical protein SORBI_3001G068066 [Sorghum bicolor]
MGSGASWSRTNERSGGQNPRNQHERGRLWRQAGGRWCTSDLQDVDRSWHGPWKGWPTRRQLQEIELGGSRIWIFFIFLVN